VVSSPEAYATARRWIKECLETHGGCPKWDEKDSPSLPTRVLDLSSDGGIEKVKLHISHGEKGQYTSLSYCWGSTPQMMTNKSTVSSFIDGIEVEKLPRTLRDAIFSTQKLGIPYLWIDYLCIIQDDEDDKGIEISKMPKIYKNAIVTISAASAPDCGMGFLEDRHAVLQRQQVAFCLPFDPDNDEVPLGQDESRIGSVFVYADSDLGFKVNDFKDEPVNSCK
jgi:hypothetical protein